MNMKYKNEFKIAFKTSIPVMIGYIVLGFAFGLLVVSLNYPWYIAFLRLNEKFRGLNHYFFL